MWKAAEPLDDRAVLLGIAQRARESLVELRRHLGEQPAEGRDRFILRVAVLGVLERLIAGQD